MSIAIFIRNTQRNIALNIVEVRLTECTQRLHDPSWKFARAQVPQLEGHVLELTDDAGFTGLGYAHAIPAITTHGAGARSALEWLRPVLLHRQIDSIASVMEELEVLLAFNFSVKATVDMALHDLLGKRLGVPVSTLLGGRLRDAIPQSRILAIKAPSEMARKAEELVTAGYTQLKLKLSGDTALDIERVAAVRAAAGPATVLTLDPNQSYSCKQMMQAFSKMERHDIALIEQPVPASDTEGLALLTRTLPTAIEADESAQTVDDVFKLVTDRQADVINLKITKLGGIGRFMQAVHICEAGNVICRVGAAFGPALLQAMGAQVASVIKNLPYGCELSEHQHLNDDPFESLPVDNGLIAVPAGPGGGLLYRKK